MDINTCQEEFNNSTLEIQNDCIQLIIDCLTNTLFHKIQLVYLYYGSTALVLPAIIFNILSLAVLCRIKLKLKTCRATSTNLYMIYLCLTDTLTLLMKFLNEFIIVRNALRTTPFSLNSFFCKAIFFSESLFSTASIYLLVAMTFDKFICVLVPLHISIILTRRRAKLVCLMVTLGSMILAFYHLLDQHHENSVCEETGLSNRMKMWDNLMKVFLPFVLITLLNSMIFVILMRKRHGSKTVFQENEFLTVHNAQVGQKRENFIFVMLLTVSCVFLVLNLPYALITIYGLVNGLYLQIDEQILNKSQLIRMTHFEIYLNLSLFLLDLTHVVNFFLYFFSGSKFRLELFELFKCKKINNQKRSSAAMIISMRKTSSSSSSSRDC